MPGILLVEDNPRSAKSAEQYLASREQVRRAMAVISNDPNQQPELSSILDLSSILGSLKCLSYENPEKMARAASQLRSGIEYCGAEETYRALYGTIKLHFLGPISLGEDCREKEKGRISYKPRIFPTAGSDGPESSGAAGTSAYLAVPPVVNIRKDDYVFGIFWERASGELEARLK